MNIRATSIDDLINKSLDHKQLMINLDRLITETLPQLERYFFDMKSMSAIAYGRTIIKAKTYEKEYPLIALAPQKNTVNIYVQGEKDGIPIIEYYQGKVGKTTAGKTCLRIKSFEKLELPMFKQFLIDAAKQ
ncbi:hypothetical protein [Mycoplasma sp. P36-A1]|uniref:hypothetical protein n=1 Tax=Mycoplasma sp. P36-A1 TaxID=3252900 RepID=UPI003C2DB021